MFSDLPLSGVKVNDLTKNIMGPYTSQLLGDRRRCNYGRR